jgi:hypothetical protein
MMMLHSRLSVPNRRFLSTVTTSFEDYATGLLTGHWKGRGEVIRKGKKNFPYLEETEFKVIAKGPDAVVYRMQQYSEHGKSGVPMHTENGFIKLLNVEETEGAGLKVEAGFTHPFPNSTINEITFGTLTDKQELILEAPNVESFHRAIPAIDNDQLTGYKRIYRRDGDTLTYDQYLSFGDSEFYHHLHADLELLKTGLFK